MFSYCQATLDLNNMLQFAQAVNAGSFTATTHELGMPKSTLSRRISNLKAQLGSRLLHRTTKSLRLTDISADFYEQNQLTGNNLFIDEIKRRIGVRI